jgi:hypothetical protein
MKRLLVANSRMGSVVAVGSSYAEDDRTLCSPG